MSKIVPKMSNKDFEKLDESFINEKWLSLWINSKHLNVDIMQHYLHEFKSNPANILILYQVA